MDLDGSNEFRTVIRQLRDRKRTRRTTSKGFLHAMADVIADSRNSARSDGMFSNVIAGRAQAFSVEPKRRRMAGTTGLEPATSDVTGRRSNQLNYVPARRQIGPFNSTTVPVTTLHFSTFSQRNKHFPLRGAPRALAPPVEFSQESGTPIGIPDHASGRVFEATPGSVKSVGDCLAL